MGNDTKRDLQDLKIRAEAILGGLRRESQYRRELNDPHGADRPLQILYHAQDVQEDGIVQLIKAIDDTIKFEAHTMDWVRNFTKSKSPM